MQTILGIFLLIHGFIHGAYLAPKPDDPKYPFDFTKSWFFKLTKGKAEPIGNLLVVFTIIMFVLSAMAAFGMPGLVDMSQSLIVIASALSLITLSLFWHKWLIGGIIVDIFLICGVFIFGWFSY